MRQNQDICPGISGQYQRLNASLAHEIARCWLAKRSHTPLLPHLEAYRVLASTLLPGRQHSFRFGRANYFIDVAHTPESIHDSVSWFCGRERKRPGTLIFYCSKPRNPSELFSIFLKVPLNCLYFPVYYDELDPSRFRELLAIKNAHMMTDRSQLVRFLQTSADQEQDVFVCGSFYVAGDVLKYLHEEKPTVFLQE